VIPLLQLGPLQGFTPTVTMQVTYRNLNQTLYQLTMTHQIGWDITLDPLTKKLNFICFQPTNRSSAQTIVAKVVFSENYENLKATQYQRSQRFLSNLALVGGQGEGEERILVQVGDAEGLQRKEVFINAKDQRWEEELSEQEYIDVLIQKGWQSLQPEVEFFESEVDVNGSTRIRQDFDLGDTVSIEMSQWNMQIHVQVTEISEVFDEMGLRVIPIFGQSLGGMQNQFESDTSGSGSSSTISLPINKAVVTDSNGQLTTGTVTAQEIAMLAGVSSTLQTQLNGKQATITGAASSVTANNLTASRATVSDTGGKIASSSVTSTELSYVSGVTSAIQSQINGKAASSHTHLASQITDFLNKVYPVGAIYLSTVSTSPATLFGGSWTQIQNRFLVAAGSSYGAGSTGGSETHTHTSAAHKHGSGHEGGDGDLWATVTGASGYIYFREDGTVPYTQATWSASHRVSGTYGSTSATVGGGADVRGSTSTTTPGATGSSSTNPPYLVRIHVAANRIERSRMLLQLMMALPIALLVNILLGVAIASTKLEFDKQKLIQGLVKGISIYLAIGGLVVVAKVIPTIDVEGVGQLDILNALTVIISTVLGIYVYKDLQKLMEVLQLKTQASDSLKALNQPQGTSED
jgi:hypothetical protein